MTHSLGRPMRGRGAEVDRLIWRAVDVLLLIVVAGLVFAVSCQAASRLFGFTAPWTEELARFLFVWTAFLGMATGFRRGEHPRIVLLVAALPAGLRRLSSYLSAAATVTLFLIVGWYAAQLLIQRITFGEISPVLGVGMWVATVPVVLGSILAALGSVLAIARDGVEETAPLGGPADGAGGLDRELRP